MSDVGCFVVGRVDLGLASSYVVHFYYFSFHGDRVNEKEMC